MKKLFVLAAMLFAVPAFAQSAKVTMQMGKMKATQKATLAVGPGEYASPDWTTIMTGAIHTSSQKDLMFGVSLETSLFTDTMVSSSRYTKDTSSAEAKIEVAVFVDGKQANPGDVTFDRRKQTLMASFDGFSCKILPDGTIALDGCSYADEVVQFTLDTLAAHAFFFSLPDVGTGDHKIEVKARTSTFASSQAGAASAQAVIGKGAFTVEEVRLVKSTDVSAVPM